MGKKHAVLSASSSHRWINCPPSVRLSEQYEDKSSVYAAEGTAAHTLSEHKLRLMLGHETQDPTENLTYYNEEMEECAKGYAVYISELVEAAKHNCTDPVVLIEERVNFSKYVPEGFGTADCIVIADGTLHIVDFKYGLGVLVEAEDNPQMKLYALGALSLFDGIYDITGISMTVYQPRRENISTHTVFKESLYQWAEEVLKPAADLAYAGEGEFKCGDWCGFCKAKYECRERAEQNLKLAEYDFRKPPLLEDSEVEEILAKVDQLVSWASDIQKHALQAALGGKQWEGWKLVEGRSNRRYINDSLVAQEVQSAGYDPYEQKLKGITEMEKLLGKKHFNELLGSLVEKPKGKPALVPMSDKRAPIQNSAEYDFKNLTEDEDNE